MGRRKRSCSGDRQRPEAGGARPRSGGGSFTTWRYSSAVAFGLGQLGSTIPPFHPLAAIKTNPYFFLAQMFFDSQNLHEGIFTYPYFCCDCFVFLEAPIFFSRPCKACISLRRNRSFCYKVNSGRPGIRAARRGQTKVTLQQKTITAPKRDYIVYFLSIHPYFCCVFWKHCCGW
jgi:hypothetical protein